MSTHVTAGVPGAVQDRRWVRLAQLARASGQQSVWLTYRKHRLSAVAAARPPAVGIDDVRRGQHELQKAEAGISTIEMGARPYVPGLGRFLRVDPVEGGSADDYEYAFGDPVNGFDLDGRCAETPSQRVRSVHCTPSTPNEFEQARRNERAQAARREHRGIAEEALARRGRPVRQCSWGEVYAYGFAGNGLSPPSVGTKGWMGTSWPSAPSIRAAMCRDGRTLPRGAA